MPRDIPIGNGSLLVMFDDLYRVRDLYYPRVGRHNHTDGHVQRFGVWADGRMAWIEEPGWTRELKYKTDTLVTEVRLIHEELGLEVICEDAVDFHDPIYFRRSTVRDLLGHARDVRLFFHCDFSINGSAVGDTANYDPTTSGVVMYKDDSYFLVNASDDRRCGIDHWAIGTKRIGDAEGTWRDAEDGELGRNAISQGSVDATVGFNLRIPAFGESKVTSWIACGHTYQDVKHLNNRIWEKGAERLLARTEAYWQLWSRKEPHDTSCFSPRAADLFRRSQLILRTQIDNGGAIIAANDSDITHFAGDHYSYCWMRDGALVTHALIRCGQSELSRAFFRFAADCIEEDGYFLHKYTPEGNLASSWHPWMLDGEKILPIQQDETALIVWALRQHFDAFRDVEFIKPLYSQLVARPAEWMLSHRDANGLPLQSWDLWEERRGIHTFTVASTIGGLEAAAAFASDFGERDRARLFREGAERMRAALHQHMWNPEERRFARRAEPTDNGGYTLDMTHDSANYALVPIAGFDPRDPAIAADIDAWTERLWVKTGIGGIARYENDYYHQVESENTQDVPGNPWVICTLWHAQCLIQKASNLGELERALPLIEWCVDRARPSGVLAEQFEPYTGAPMSVSPLTWSHATYAIICVEYMRRHEELQKMSSHRQPVMS